jgi:hypothetical protein
MADKTYPRVLYHQEGQHKVVNSDAEEKAAGAGWSDTTNDNSIQGIRKAAGAIAEVIEPVQRVRQERTDR